MLNHVVDLGLGAARVAKPVVESGFLVGRKSQTEELSDHLFADRADIRRNPPDILITTPESLYLMLTSLSREALRTVTTVIVDEIHVMAGTKRGAHLALSLERLEQVTGRPFQRIGLSATHRPLDELMNAHR